MVEKYEKNKIMNRDMHSGVLNFDCISNFVITTY